MVFICYDAGDIVEYDKWTPEMSNVPPRMKQDVTSIE